MRRLAIITVLFACAVLGPGCSPSDEQTAASPTATPAAITASELTAEQRAALEKENQAAIDEKRKAAGLPPEEAAASPTATP